MIGALIRNGQAVSISDIPMIEALEFRSSIRDAVSGGARIAALFGQPLDCGRVRLWALLAHDAQHTLSVLSTAVLDTFPALTPDCPQAHLFEREIFEQTGLRPEGHPLLKPVRCHDFDEIHAENHKYRYFTMVGDEIHEVAVGPVHAGVIEPGHFRFQCHGEIVHHLEIHLGYQHRGIEEALIGGPHKRTMLQMETVAGDTSIGHATSYVLDMEALGGIQAPPRAQALRAVALELERLANHVGDMGALASDVGFLPTASFCGRLRGDFLNMTAIICGSRLGRGLVRPGGVAFDLDDALLQDLLKRLDAAERELMPVLAQFFQAQSVRARLNGTGPVSLQAARDLGLVGPAARASGVSLDARTDHPSGWYQKATIPVAGWDSGDVLARALVRRMEIERSIAFFRSQLASLPTGSVHTPCPPPAPLRLAVAITEGWRGEVVHMAITNAQGTFARYKIIDPSFHNWMGLAMALRGQQISDFPLCNKSFNLSYCGFDL